MFSFFNNLHVDLKKCLNLNIFRIEQMEQRNEIFINFLHITINSIGIFGKINYCRYYRAGKNRAQSCLRVDSPAKY